MTRPVIQLTVSIAVMLGGAWLIGMWAVGLVLFILGGLAAADALWRDDDRRQPPNALSSEVLERWRRAK